MRSGNGEDGGNGSGGVRITLGSAALGSLAIALVAGYVSLNVQLNGTTYEAAGANRANSEMQQRVGRLEARLEQLETSSTRQESALTEVETQFRAEDQTRNMMHLYDLRQIALLWQKVFGQRFPTDANYFPDIGKK